MNWQNLKKNKCPQCNKDTALRSPYNFNPITQVFEHPCGFKISKEKFELIVSDQVTRSLEQQLNEEYGEESLSS